jgi:hypothetical protein
MHDCGILGGCGDTELRLVLSDATTRMAGTERGARDFLAYRANLLTQEEAMRYGESRPYAWGEFKKGWRIWGVPCDGIMAKILGAHNIEFEDKVEHINKRAKVFA